MNYIMQITLTSKGDVSSVPLDFIERILQVEPQLGISSEQALITATSIKAQRVVKK
jgi:hypothetical protein